MRSEDSSCAFVIVPRTVSAVFVNKVKTYTGSALYPDVIFENKLAQDTLSPLYTVEGVDDGARNAGTYKVTVAIANTNYILDAATATIEDFVILPKTLTAVWSNTVLTYNGALQNPTVALSGVVAGENVIATLSEGKRDAGVYMATVTVADANYLLRSDTATVQFEIRKAAVGVSWSANTVYTYDGSAKAPVASAVGVSITYTYERYNSVTGAYEVIAQKPWAIGNYRVTAVTVSGIHTLFNSSREYSIVASTGNH